MINTWNSSNFTTQRDVMMLLLVQAANALHTQEILGTSDSLGEAPQNTVSMCEEGPCMDKNWLTNCNMYHNLYIMYKQNFVNQLLK
jgi:hypothetical protein